MPNWAPDEQARAITQPMSKGSSDSGKITSWGHLSIGGQEGGTVPIHQPVCILNPICADYRHDDVRQSLQKVSHHRQNQARNGRLLSHCRTVRFWPKPALSAALDHVSSIAQEVVGVERCVGNLRALFQPAADGRLSEQDRTAGCLMTVLRCLQPPLPSIPTPTETPTIAGAPPWNGYEPPLDNLGAQLAGCLQSR